MRIKLLVDTQVQGDIDRVNNALQKIKQDYVNTTLVRWDIEYHSFTDAPWGAYNTQGNKGLGIAYIEAETKRIYQKHNLEYDHVIFCIAPENWRDPAIGGWHLSTQFNNYSVEIVKVSDSDEWLYKIFAMEIIHAIDDFCWYEANINLDALTGLDWDYDIIHGEHPDYGTDVRGTWAEKFTKTGYYTDYIYTPVIKKFGVYITAVYKKREDKYNTFIVLQKQYVSLLEKYVYLLKQFVAKYNKPKASAVYMAELDPSIKVGNKHIH